MNRLLQFFRGSGDDPQLDWVDEYIRRVKPYIYVRMRDHLLIKRPNQVVKLNPTGALILHELLAGTSIRAVMGDLDRRKKDEVALFLHAVRKQVESGLNPYGGHPAVETEQFEAPFSEWPVLSEVALTYRCNLRCRFCYAGCNCTRKESGRAELGVDGFREVLRQIREEAGVPSVSFTGGEPTLVPFLPDLIRYAKDLDMRVNLISNGTLIDGDMARRLVDAGLDSAQISIEAANADLHDHIAGCKGSFDRTVEGVRALVATGIHVHTNTTLHRHNLDAARDIPAFVRWDLGLDRLSMNLVIPTGSVATHGDVHVRYSDAIDPILRVRESCEREGIEFMWYSPLPMCIFNTVAHGLGNKGCAACEGLLSVNPWGEVLPCASYDDPVGSLLDEGFDTVWHSLKARYCRNKSFAHEMCRQCPDFAICQGACPLYWKVSGYDELAPFHATLNPIKS